MKQEYDKMTASELLDLRLTIDKDTEAEKYDEISEIIKSRATSIKKELQKHRFEYKYHTFFPRLSAMLLDSYLMVPIRWLEAVIIVKLSGGLYEFFIWFILVDMILYSILFHSVFGQTLGNNLVKVKVVNNNDESKIGFKQAFIRDSVPLVIMTYLFFAGTYESLDLFGNQLVYIVTSAYFIWTLIEIITMLSNKKRRALHDYLAGTVCVRY
jgi:uncharacterized RDD family membrane protein YckC